MLRRLVNTAAGLLLSANALGAVDAGPATAPRLEFTPLPPGTYRLQQIQAVADATLVDESGTPVRLRAMTSDKITLLTFFYTYCVDPLGCPFAHQTLAWLRDRIVQGRRQLV